MPRVRGLRVKKESAADKQNVRYFHLSRFMYKVTTVNGRHQYSREGLERLLKGARVLTRDGHVRVERVQKLAKSLGVHDSAPKAQPGALPDVFYDEGDMWDYIAEGGSP